MVLGVTQTVEGTALGHAIMSEARRRKMEPFDHFVVPDDWGRGYARLAKSIPYCADFRTVDLARQLVRRFIDPALDRSAAGKTWSHQQRDWN